MRPAQLASWCTALAGLAAASPAAANSDTTVYHDPETGFTFSQYFAKYSLTNHGITFRVAVPAGVPSSSDFDVVVQIVAPSEVGWAGLAWGGGMTKNPLAVAWASPSRAIISSRWADGHYLPQPYDGSTYQVLSTGTKNNGTHWQVTAKCTGCTSYGSSSRVQRLSAVGSNRLAFAYSAAKVSNPSSNTSSFGEHSVIGFWDHDFNSAANPTFTSLVTKNLR